MQIRSAEEKDLETIVSLNNAESPWVGEPEKIVFFRENLSIPFFYVAEQEGRVVGFMMVMDQDSNYDSQYFRWFKKYFQKKASDMESDAKFLYVDRLVVDPEKRERGIAKSIYEQLKKDGKNLPVAGEISIDPPNRVSLIVHEKFGFVCVGEKKSDDGTKTCGMYVLNP